MSRERLYKFDLEDIEKAMDSATRVVYQSQPWTTVILNTTMRGEEYSVAGWSKVCYPDKFKWSTGIKIAHANARRRLQFTLEESIRERRSKISFFDSIVEFQPDPSDQFTL
jgi:hypothetical protein